MKSIFDEGPHAPCPTPFNMAAYVLAHARRTPDKTALLVLGEEDWTFAALEAAVLGTATGLLAQGALPGDRILMRLGNTVDFPLSYLGAIAAGLVPVPTAAQLTAREVAPMIETLQPKLILHDPAIECPDDPRRISLEALRQMRSLPAASYDMGDPERPGYIVYTSGTSGKPRAVVHAHRAIWARQMMHQGWYGLHASDRMLHAGAFNWTYTLGTGLMDPWSVGATALIPAAGTSARDLSQLIAHHSATIFAAAPGVYRQLLQTDVAAMPTLRHGLSAGEKLPPAVRARWEAATRTTVYEAYGMSECSTFISASPAHPAAPDVLGRPQIGRKIALLDAQGQIVAQGDAGTIAVHQSDPGLMLGYLDAPQETAAKMQGPWFLTGDQGSMDGEHQITYLGRKDDMMNAGGFRVSPLEVESCLAQMDGITGVAAVEVAVKEDVSVIAAFYTGPAPLDETVLRDYATANLARYKQPRLYIHLPHLPMGANGKLLRRTLRENFEAEK